MEDVDEKKTDVSRLVTTTVLNTKISEVKSKIQVASEEKRLYR